MSMNFSTKATIGIILKDLFTKEQSIKFKEFLDSLEFEIVPMRMEWGLGFANDKLYIDLLKCFWRDQELGLDGEFTLMVLLHEIGHMIRLTADDNKLLKFIDEVEDFDDYFKTVLEEEEFTELYTQEKFEELLGRPLPPEIMFRIPDINTDHYRGAMLDVFQKKQEYGSWPKFLEEYEQIKDYEYVIKEPTWNTMFTERERLVRCAINGQFYNPFDIPKDVVLFNPFTYKAIRADGTHDPEDYNEKDVCMFDPFSGRLHGKASYENGLVVEAFTIENDEWIAVDLENIE